MEENDLFSKSVIKDRSQPESPKGEIDIPN